MVKDVKKEVKKTPQFIKPETGSNSTSLKNPQSSALPTPKPGIEALAVRLTKAIGTPQSIVIHTLLFISPFFFYLLGVALDTIMLVLTTIVSLEAIYLSLFIQMSVNRQAESLEDFGEDLEDIQEDVKGLEEEVDEISEDLEDIQEEDKKDEELEEQTKDSLKNIEEDMDKLLSDIESLKKNIATTNLTKKYLNG
jgi:uncharacterized membrane protein